MLRDQDAALYIADHDDSETPYAATWGYAAAFRLTAAAGGA